MAAEISRGFRMWLYLILFGVLFAVVQIFATPMFSVYGLLGLLVLIVLVAVASLWALGYAAKRTD